MGSVLRLVLACFLLTACAPTVQQALVAPAAFAGPHFDTEAQRFYSFDGAPLGLTAWRPEQEEPWAVIVAAHGMNDYGEAFYLAGPWWAKQGIATYAYDARGHGRSPRRGVWGGTRLLTEDLRTAVRVARRAHPGALIAVVGDSMGAATAITAFASDDPPPADRLVLVAPAVVNFEAAAVPADTLVVYGEADDVVPLQAVLDWARPQGLPVTVLPGAGHFFHGQLTQLRHIVGGAWAWHPARPAH